jgi:hypothetical protein
MIQYEYITPALLENSVDEFGIMHWDKDYIIEKDGNTKVNVTNWGRPVSKNLNISIEEFYKTYKNDGYYIFSVAPMVEYIPQHLKRQPYYQILNIINDINIPNRYKDFKFDMTLLYVGNIGMGALPHNHGAAYNLLVSGKKKWLFFDTSKEDGIELQKQYYNDYPYKTLSDIQDWYDNEYNTSIKKYRDGGGVVIEFIQNAGDVVVVPTLWSHTVLNIEECLGAVLFSDWMGPKDGIKKRLYGNVGK